MNPGPGEAERLVRRIRVWTVLFMVGLVLSGATALPLETELGWLVQWTGADGTAREGTWQHWLWRVGTGLQATNQQFPFMAYGTDWLAFAHFVIAVAFIGAWREPVRNRWLFDFGLIACGMVIPFALIAGAARGIPLYWRLIDCAFGVGGAIPLWLCRQLALRVERLRGEDYLPPTTPA